jgi:hypothetical protein
MPTKARRARQSVTIAIQNSNDDGPQAPARDQRSVARRYSRIDASMAHGAIMKSARFIHPAHRRIFRYGMAAAFLLGLGILAACRPPQSSGSQAEEAPTTAAR